jgi:hypothetical protein
MTLENQTSPALPSAAEIVERPQYTLKGSVVEDGETMRIMFDNIDSVANAIDDNDEYDVHEKPLPPNYVTCAISYAGKTYSLPLAEMAMLMNNTSRFDVIFRGPQFYGRQIREALQSLNTQNIVDKVRLQKKLTTLSGLKNTTDVDAEKKRLEEERNKKAIREKAWTEQDILKLLVEKGLSDEQVFSEKYRHEMQIDRFDKPQNLLNDFQTLERLLALEQKDMKLNGKEKLDISQEGEDLLRGLLLWQYTIAQWYAISIDASHQPVIHDTTWSKDPNREKQTKTLQETIAKIDYKGKDRLMLSRYDRSSQAKVYLTAASYHLGKQTDMTKKIEGINAKAPKPIDRKLTTEEIMKNPKLSAEEKTLLSMWSSEESLEKLDILQNIQSDQEKYVKNARENIGWSSYDNLVKNLRDAPISTALKTFAVPAICAMLLFKGIDAIFWDGAWYTKLLWVPMAMIGLAVVPSLDKLVKKTGATTFAGTSNPELKRDQAEQLFGGKLTRVSKKAYTATVQNMSWFSDRYLSGGHEWSTLIMDPTLGTLISSYPVGVMLAALHPPAPGKKDPYEAYRSIKDSKGNLLITEVQNKLINKLGGTPDRHPILTNMLETAWKKHETKHGIIQTGADAAQNPENMLKLPTMLQSMDHSTGWFESIYDHSIGWVHDRLTSRDEVRAFLPLMSEKPDGWWSLTLWDLEAYFRPYHNDKWWWDAAVRKEQTGFHYAFEENSPAYKAFEDKLVWPTGLLGTNIKIPSSNREKIIAFLGTIDPKMMNEQKSMTLREYFEKR